MAGRVFDKATKGPLAGVTVRAKLVTANELFASRETNPGGSYSIPELPAGIYAVIVYRSGLTKGTGVLSGARRIDVTMSITRIPL